MCVNREIENAPVDYVEKIELLEEAQEKINEAVDLIREAVEDTDCESGAVAYVIPSLIMCATKEHGYLASQSYNCDELIKSLGEEKREKDKEEEERQREEAEVFAKEEAEKDEKQNPLNEKICENCKRPISVHTADDFCGV
jgi:hypothetical protein